MKRTEDSPDFVLFKAAYPKRLGSQNWTGAARNCRARLKEGYTWTQITQGAAEYADHIRETGREFTVYVKQACTFVGRDLHFLETYKAIERVDPTSW